MKDKKMLLREIMTALAKADNENAEKLTKIFLEYVPEITAEEVSKVAQQLDDEGVFADANQHINIERQVFEIIKTKIPTLDLQSYPAGHPIATFLAENKIVLDLKQRAKELLETPDSFNNLKSDWVLLAKQFSSLDIHYLRKENQLFPYLEKKGFSHPSTIMWSLHDEIRRQAKEYSKAVTDNDEKLAAQWLTKLMQEAYEMTVKEEKVLLPRASQLLNPVDWFEIRKGEDEIGWMIPEPPMWTPGSNAENSMESTNAEASERVEPQVFNAQEAQRTTVGGINLEVGSITPEQINLIFKHLPFDVTYVDEFDEVRYYNKGDDRVFPRSPGIIGRQVKYCHPPKSVHIVEKIVDAFKKGERNEANFWINFQGKFVYIQYFAVRDERGHYRGVVEITYDGTNIRNLKGEQRLLDWE